MLRPRNFVRLQQYMSYINIPTTLQNASFSLSRCVRQQNNSNSQSTIFVPTTPSTKRTSFSKESPLKQPALEGIEETPPPEIPAVSIDNYLDFETRMLPQTGKLSGRTVSCPTGKMNMALGQLSRILRENKVQQEWSSHHERLKPSEARRKLRAKRHRVRFKQGVARLANIVLRMRKKNY
jgi:hypothetical protein